MAMLIFDPKNPLCNGNGTYRSMTRRIAKPRQAVVDGYIKYARTTKDVEIWHSRNAVKGNHFQAVTDLLEDFVLRGDKVLEDGDNWLAEFVKIQGEG